MTNSDINPLSALSISDREYTTYLIRNTGQGFEKGEKNTKEKSDKYENV